jgi:hypothetical protein
MLMEKLEILEKKHDLLVQEVALCKIERREIDERLSTMEQSPQKLIKRSTSQSMDLAMKIYRS